MNGVGTRDGFNNGFGQIGGYGGKSRIERMLDLFEIQKKEGDCTLDIVGFSRGAAMAREFANRVKEKEPNARIRWMGLFDTVASFGLGGNDINVNYRMKIPDSVDSVFHLVAGSETRFFFPLSSIRPSENSRPLNRDWREVTMPGAHSDVGGGYRDQRSLANISLKLMHADGLKHGVPFDPIPKDYLFYPTRAVHDSRWMIDRVFDFWHTSLPPEKRRTFYDK